MSLVLQSERVVLPEGLRPGRLTVEEGRIRAIEPWSPAGPLVSDVGEHVIMAGLVDTHVHVNEPGRTDWEGFESATMAAAAGGVTTVVDMPLNSVPPTLDAASLELKREAALRSVWVDVGYFGGFVPANSGELKGLADAGVLGFKCFLVDSGVEEFAPVDEKDLDRILPDLRTWGLPLIVHAEAPEVLAEPGQRFASLEPSEQRSYAAYLASRPAESEDEAVKRLAALAWRHRAAIHVAHVSSAGVPAIIRGAKLEGVPLSGETCPHYLTFAAEEIPDDATEYKCAPPIRDAANRESLWTSLRKGAIEMVVSDHSPCPADLKRGTFAEAWGGISSLQLRLAATWTEARARGFGLSDVARWLGEAPAQLVGLRRKGTLVEGSDADVVVWDPEASFVVERLLHRHPGSPYLGRRLYGVVKSTYLRGHEVWNGSINGKPRGRLIEGRS